ncbi:hypothetical protein ACROYT_G009164 [Oculina patagonica]
MACCSFSELVSGDCGSSLDNPTNIKCVTLRECTKEVYSHLVFCKVSDDSEIDTEWKLLLARAGVFEVDESHLAMNICPRHRDLFGVRWRSSKTNCTIPDEIASHKSKAKGLCGLRRKQSQFVYHRTQKLIPVGSNSEGSREAAVFSCLQEGCVRVFQRLSSLEKHLSLESCTKTLERQSLSDIAKITYASLLQEGAAPIPSTCPTSTEHRVVSSSILSEGWALRAPKKSYRFNTKHKEYLEAKFNVGQVTGRKVNPDVVAKDMRRARDEGGEKLFCSSEFLTFQQVTSFFSRLAAKRRQQLATEEDVCAATEEENFYTARESVLSSLDLQHPITYEQFNICALVRESKLNKLKVAMLQVICEALNLETPVPAVKRKAPYTALLVDAVSKCSCSDTG